MARIGPDDTSTGDTSDTQETDAQQEAEATSDGIVSDLVDDASSVIEEGVDRAREIAEEEQEQGGTESPTEETTGGDGIPSPSGGDSEATDDSGGNGIPGPSPDPEPETQPDDTTQDTTEGTQEQTDTQETDQQQPPEQTEDTTQQSDAERAEELREEATGTDQETFTYTVPASQADQIPTTATKRLKPGGEEIVVTSDEPKGGALIESFPESGTQIIKTEKNVPVGGYRFDRDDPEDVQRFIEGREGRQQADERLAQREEARQELQQGDFESRAELKETFATAVDTANPALDISEADVRLQETNEGIQPTLTQEAEQQFRELGRERQRLIAAQEADAQNPNVDITKEDINLFGAEGGGLQAELTRGTQEEIQQIRAEQLREQRAQELDERFSDTEITKGDIQVQQEGEQLRAQLKSDVESDIQRQQARENIAEQLEAENEQIIDLDPAAINLEQTDEGFVGSLDVEFEQTEQAQLTEGEEQILEQTEPTNVQESDFADIQTGTDRAQYQQTTAFDASALAAAEQGSPGVVEGFAETTTGAVADIPESFDEFAQASGQISARTGETIAVGSQELGGKINVGVDVATAPVDIATGQEVDIDEEGALGSGAGKFIEGTGRGLVGGTVGLPAFAQTVGETGVEAAEFTAEQPTEAPGAAFDVSKKFVESEAARAQSQPLRFAGEVTGGALIGAGFGKAVSGTRLAEGRTGAALRKVDVGTRSFRRARAELRGLRGKGTSDLARSSVVGSRVADLDFGTFKRAERGQFQIGRQATPDAEPDTSKIMAEDIEPRTEEPSQTFADPSEALPERRADIEPESRTAQRREGRIGREAGERSPDRPRDIAFERSLSRSDAQTTPALATGALGAQAGAVGSSLLEQAQTPQVDTETQTLSGVAEDTDILAGLRSRTELAQQTAVRTDLDTITETQTRTLADVRTRVSPRAELDIGVKPFADTQQETRTETTPDVTPDPTPDPTPQTRPDPTPDPRPDLDLPRLGDPDDDKRKSRFNIQEDQFDNEVLAPGEAREFNPFGE